MHSYDFTKRVRTFYPASEFSSKVKTFNTIEENRLRRKLSVYCKEETYFVSMLEKEKKKIEGDFVERFALREDRLSSSGLQDECRTSERCCIHRKNKHKKKNRKKRKRERLVDVLEEGSIEKDDKKEKSNRIYGESFLPEIKMTSANCVAFDYRADNSELSNHIECSQRRSNEKTTKQRSERKLTLPPILQSRSLTSSFSSCDEHIK